MTAPPPSAAGCPTSGASGVSSKPSWASGEATTMPACSAAKIQNGTPTGRHRRRMRQRRVDRPMRRPRRSRGAGPSLVARASRRSRRSRRSRAFCCRGRGAKPTSVVAHDEPSPMIPNASAARVEPIRNTVVIPNRSLRYRRHRGDQVAPGEAGEDLTERTVSPPEVVAEVGPDRADRPVGQPSRTKAPRPMRIAPGVGGKAAGHRAVADSPARILITSDPARRYS